MNDQFVDFENSRILNLLGFDEPCMKYHCSRGLVFSIFEEGMSNTELVPHKQIAAAPLWQQVEQWLWEHHGITIQVISTNGIIDVSDKWVWDVKKENKMLFYQHEIKYHDSPITAKIEGIKQAVKYLHSKLKQ